MKKKDNLSANHFLQCPKCKLSIFVKYNLALESDIEYAYSYQYPKKKQSKN